MSSNGGYGMRQVESALTPFRENGVEKVKWDLIGKTGFENEVLNRDPYEGLESVAETLNWLYDNHIIHYQEHDIQETDDGKEVEFKVDFYEPHQRRDFRVRIESPGYDRDKAGQKEPQTGIMADD